MAPGRRAVKSESIVAPFGGLATPGPSNYSASVSPKREIELVDLSGSYSDDQEDDPQPTSSNHGLPSYPVPSLRSGEGSRSASASISLSNISPSSLLASRLQVSRQLSRNMPPPSQTMDDPLGFEFVGRHLKASIDTISDLRKFSLDHVVQLAEVVMVGDQSAGKSSLMSRLTGIELPRDQGICTKCPANIKTSASSDGQWTCKVSLQQNWRYEKSKARSISTKSVNSRNPFPPWVEQPMEIKEFMTLDHKFQLEEAIKWAQLALLNHDEDYTAFIPGQGHRTSNGFEPERDRAEAKFSPNLIAIDISGPDLPALSFYDLPGIFAVAAKPEDQYLANVIKNLAILYIKRPNALIVCCIAMKTDPSTSSTGKVIRDCGASHRTVAVLTNPDHVHSRHLEYEKILLGKDHVVGHGYYVTRQPGDAASIPPGPDYLAQARRLEKEFFDTDPLWTGEWSKFRNRCGTEVIQDFLSYELASSIIQSIPSIQEKIAAEACRVDRALSECPDLPDKDIRNIIRKILSDFGNDARTVMNGDSLDTIESFQSEWSTLSANWFSLMKHIKPMVGVAEIVQIDLSVEDDEEPIIDHTNRRKRPGVDAASATKRQRGNEPHTPQHSITFETPPPPSTGRTPKREDLDSRDPPVMRPLRRTVASNPFVGTVFESFANLGKGFTDVGRIHQKINQHARSGLAGLVDPKTQSTLCVESIKPWPAPLKVFLDKTVEMVRKQLQDLLIIHLGVYEQTELYRTAQKYLNQLIDRHTTELRRDVDKLLRREQHKSWTLDDESLQAVESVEYKRLQLARRKVRAKAEVEKQIRDDPKKRLSLDMAPDEREKIVSKRVGEIVGHKDANKEDDPLPADHLDKEVRVAAYVRGYYNTAAKRFVDSVCLSIHNEYFVNLWTDIKTYLEDKFHINSVEGEEICRSLMEEDDAKARVRRSLRTEKENLVGFANRLEQLVVQLTQDQSEPANGNAANRSDLADENDDEGSQCANDRRRSLSDDVDMNIEGSEDTIGVGGAV
ncbi:uncharacterized protein LY89DRAFT_652811 [Mollisia scopiformis]|uniref:GED domain-containing protein n=1 Tax=Mollisia scopiformis TaxID=149040 RepID=A0A194WWM6_MOLSC|nr:uncharacterized protein LY89DRAFT_652811 [Mollisia scopiformis]KUJ12350.1 hypothetical protein LY89DRAFT_652811 [Mollisia scopiformis]